jgi:RNA polymerase sigma factor (sigma-70 family)
MRPSRSLPTIELVRQAQHGQAGAENLLLERIMPRFYQWASGRLPGNLRGYQDTGDLAQEILIRFRRNLSSFDPERSGVYAYLRTAFLNRIRDLARRSHPEVEVDDRHWSSDRSPFDDCVARETAEAYESALDSLAPEEREAVIMRVELHYDYARIAEELARPNAAAARAFLNRTLLKLARSMRVQHA